MEETNKYQEWGRKGALKRASLDRDARERAERAEAECVRLRNQKSALIAYARGKGATAEGIVSLLAVDDVTPLAVAGVMRELFDYLTKELQHISRSGEGADQLVVEAAKAHALGQIADAIDRHTESTQSWKRSGPSRCLTPGGPEFKESHYV